MRRFVVVEVEHTSPVHRLHFAPGALIMHSRLGDVYKVVGRAGNRYLLQRRG